MAFLPDDSRAIHPSTDARLPVPSAGATPRRWSNELNNSSGDTPICSTASTASFPRCARPTQLTRPRPENHGGSRVHARWWLRARGNLRARPGPRGANSRAGPPVSLREGLTPRPGASPALVRRVHVRAALANDARRPTPSAIFTHVNLPPVSSPAAVQVQRREGCRRRGGQRE